MYFIVGLMILVENDDFGYECMNWYCFFGLLICDGVWKMGKMGYGLLDK